MTTEMSKPHRNDDLDNPPAEGKTDQQDHKSSDKGKILSDSVGQRNYVHEHVDRLTLDNVGLVSHIEVAVANQDRIGSNRASVIIEEVAFDYANKAHTDIRQRTHLHGRKLVLAFLAWLATEFMGGLGGNMLSPALPIIASEFNGLNELGWVSGAYYMTQCGCMLLFGQCLTVFNSKYVLMSAIAFFMLGSCISGAAMDIKTLIIGRAFAGIGAAGCWVSVQTLVAMLVELEDRPKLLGLFGIQNAVSGTTGPILAGALASRGQWRWCFLLVLPLGALTILLSAFALPSLPPWPLNEETKSKLDKQLQLISGGRWKPQQEWVCRVILVDSIGFFVVTSGLICLILALQWGGSTYPWKSSIIIGLFLGFGAIMALFMFLENKVAWPMLPPRALKNRTVVGASLLAGFTLMCNLFLAIWLPVLYEAARGVSSLRAGLLIIAFLLTVVVSQAVEGFIMSYTKRYWHWGFASPSFLALGGGLLYKVNIDTSSSRLIGYQIIYGLGVGLTQNVAFLSVQADNPLDAVPSAIAIVSFVQLFGGMCGPVIGNAILSGSLRKYLPLYGVPSDTAAAVERSVQAIWDLDGDLRISVIKAYLKSLNNVYIAVVPVSFFIILSALLIRNVSLKSKDVV